MKSSAVLALFVGAALLGVGGAGCWFSKGNEGFVCESSDDCNEGLRCRAYSAKGKIRRQCRPRGTRSISSKSGYTTIAVYLSWIFWIVAPIGTVVFIVRARMKVKQEAEKKRQQQGGPPPPAEGGPGAA